MPLACSVRPVWSGARVGSRPSTSACRTVVALFRKNEKDRGDSSFETSQQLRTRSVRSRSVPSNHQRDSVARGSSSHVVLEEKKRIRNDGQQNGSGTKEGKRSPPGRVTVD